MRRRDQIAMTPEEVAAFPDEQRVLPCATHGHDGWPHLMPLWFVVRDGTLWAWTYGKSQKVVNLRRDPRCTLQVEAGADRYDQLRGVMFKVEAILHEDLETVAGVGIELAGRYGGGGPIPDEARDAVRAQAGKRVAIEFREVSRSTWDHRKLGGGY